MITKTTLNQIVAIIEDEAIVHRYSGSQLFPTLLGKVANDREREELKRLFPECGMPIDRNLVSYLDNMDLDKLKATPTTDKLPKQPQQTSRAFHDARLYSDPEDEDDAYGNSFRGSGDHHLHFDF